MVLIGVDLIIINIEVLIGRVNVRLEVVSRIRAGCFRELHMDPHISVLCIINEFK